MDSLGKNNLRKSLGIGTSPNFEAVSKLDITSNVLYPRSWRSLDTLAVISMKCAPDLFKAAYISLPFAILSKKRSVIKSHNNVWLPIVFASVSNSVARCAWVRYMSTPSTTMTGFEFEKGFSFSPSSSFSKSMEILFKGLGH